MRYLASGLAFVVAGYFVYLIAMSRPADSKTSAKPIAQIENISEQVKITRLRTPEKVDFIYPGEVVDAGGAKDLLIRFRSGHKIKFSSTAVIRLQTWDPADLASPVLALVEQGTAELVRKGTAGELYFWVRKGVLAAEALAQKANISLTSLPIVTFPKSQQEAELLAPAQDETPLPESDRPSNVDIEQQISKYKWAFEKCQLNRLRERGTFQGRIEFGLKIISTGLIEQIEVLSTDFDDEQLTQCLTTVFGRIKFRPFKGDPILRSYPMNFQ